MIFLFIGLILGAVAVIFALQNLEVITVTFLAWQLDGSLAVILILAVTTGVLIGVLVSLPGAIRSSFQISSLRKQNIGLKEQLFNDEKALQDRNNRVVQEKEIVAVKSN